MTIATFACVTLVFNSKFVFLLPALIEVDPAKNALPWASPTPSPLL